MGWMRRLVNVVRPDRLSRELDRELEFHIAERADELRALGMSEAAAVREARRRLGNDVLQKERTRDADVLVWLDTVRADVRYALRSLRNSPGFAAAAIISLALGIGANTAIFSLVDAVVLKTLPVRAPEELVQVTLGEDGGPIFPNPLWEQLRDREQAFAGVAAYSQPQFNLSQGGIARPIRGSYVSGAFFDMLGVTPAAGRLLTERDDHRGCPAVAVLDARFWQSEYGASPNAVGRSLLLDGKPFEIVGVTGASFHGVTVGQVPQVYVPLCAEAVITGDRSGLDLRSMWFLQVLGRPLPGVSIDALNAHLASIARASYESTLPEHYPADAREDYLARTFAVVPAAAGLSELRKQYSKALIVLMALVGVVLLIACANVANLMLARASARQREISLRLAIGAGRGRIVRQLLTESLVIAWASAALGIFIAVQASRALVAMLSTAADPVSLQLPIDLRVLAFTLLAAVIAALAFGLAPAWRAGRSDPQTALRASGRGLIAGESRFSTGKGLVVAQIGLSLGMVVLAGLLMGTFVRLSTDSPGFDRSNLLLVKVDLPDDLDTYERQRAMHGMMLDELRALPGAESVSLSQLTPIGRAAWNDVVFVEGHVATSESDRLAFMNEVGDRYFVTMGTRILAGREFDERDTPGAPRVVVVNEAFAKYFFGRMNVVGREIRIADDEAPLQIVGVVETARYGSLREEPQRVVYLPWTQGTERAFAMTFLIRTRAPAGELVPTITSIARTADATASLRITALAQQIAESITRERVLALLSGFFGGLALLLAMIGLYGIMAYNVTRRRNEIGIRMALGSERSRVLGMVLGEAGWMIAAGLLLGAGLAFAGTRFVASLLYGLSPNDATTLIVSAALLGFVGLTACALPAWRASRVEPMTALRDE